MLSSSLEVYRYDKLDMRNSCKQNFTIVSMFYFNFLFMEWSLSLSKALKHVNQTQHYTPALFGKIPHELLTEEELLSSHYGGS